MARDTIEKFLSTSTTAQRATVPARVVFRTEQQTPGRLAHALDSGEITFGDAATCVLVAGGVAIATGQIEEKDGHYFFRAQEAG